MSKLTRRRFLEDSMFATAAAAAATSVSGPLLAAEPQSKSPNERLSVAVVGVRGRGGSHLGAFSGRDDTEVTYICDPDERVGESRVKSTAERQQGRAPKYVKDMREVFDDPSVDIVTVATPNHWHALCGIWAIQAGKDVYVEKPVSHNVSEGRRIVEAARKYGKIVQTGTQSRSNPGMRDAIEYMHSGKLGNVTEARGLCYKRRRSIGDKGKYPVQSTIDYNLWLGPAPAPVPSEGETGFTTRRQFHYDWHWQFDYGNGDLGNQGIHQMDICRWGLGVSDIGTGVLSYGGRLGYEDAGDVANTQVCIHGYGDKMLIFEVRGLETNGYKGANVGNIFTGSEGYLVMTSYNSGSAFDPDGNLVKKFSGGADHYDNFVKAVRSRNTDDLNADIEEGHLSSALCHLGNISYRLGSQVKLAEAPDRLASATLGESAEKASTLERFREHLSENEVDPDNTEISLGAQLAVDPAKESFVGNEKANAMLTREYRAPFVVPAKDKV
jgi:predicted dehydrogenase